MPRPGQLLIEDAEIIFRNFAGREGMYNEEGNRNFCVLLEESLATQLHNDGWNVKTLKPKDVGDEPRPYIQVKVGFKFPPVLVVITSEGRTELSENEVELLDWFDIEKVDLNLQASRWNVGGRTGLKAYLKSIYLTVAEDPLKLKYAHIPIAGNTEMLAIEAAYQDPNMIDGEVVEETLAITDGSDL